MRGTIIERVAVLMYNEAASVRFADRTIYGRHGKFYVSIEKGHNTAFTVDVGGALKIGLPPEAILTFGGGLRDVIWMTWSLNWHELGHVMFTDMTLKAMDGLEGPLRDFTMEIVNIAEDVTIEPAIIRLIARDFSGYGWITPAKTFRAMNDRYWSKCARSWRNDGSLSGFVNYLLLWARLGKESIPEECKAFSERAEWLAPEFLATTKEADPARRQALQVALAKKIWESFSREERDSFSPEKILKSPGGGMSAPLSGGLRMPLPRADGGEEAGEKDERGAEGVDSGAGGDSSGDPLMLPPEASGDWDRALDSSAGHTWLSADEDMEPDASIGKIMGDRLDRAIPIADGVSDFLKLFKGRKRPRWVGGLDSGDDIDVDAVVDIERTGVPTAEIFASERPRGKTTDLAVSILIDRSGSMSHGGRATVAVDAALAMSYACDEARVPFQVLSFTKTEDSVAGEAITMVHKDWDDTLIGALPKLGAADITMVSHYREITQVGGRPFFCPSWGGNSEETNLWHIWQRLRQVEHERKLLIVFCDGGTTGSRRALAGVVREMSDDGIDVIGVGICCDDVAEIYPRSAVFHRMSDLRDGLAPFLLDTLADMATAE